MGCDHAKTHDRPDPETAPGRPAKFVIPACWPPSRPTRERPAEEPLRDILRQDWAVLAMPIADVIDAVEAATGERGRLFHGDHEVATRPVHPLSDRDRPAVLDVRVDRAGDDLEVLAEAVERVKGSCHDVGQLEQLLEDPQVLVAPGDSGIVHAVDDLKGERCGLSFGDPATEWLPLYDRMPSPGPLVSGFRVHREADDRELLAAAVRRIDGSCADRADTSGTRAAGDSPGPVRVIRMRPADLAGPGEESVGEGPVAGDL